MMNYSALRVPLNKISALVRIKYRWAYVRVKRHFKTKKNRRKAVYIIGLALILALLFGLVDVSSQRQSLQTNLVKRQQKLRQLQSNLKQLQTDKLQSDQEVKQRDKSLQDTQKQIDSLNQQLQSKNAQKSLLAQAAAVVSPGVASAAPVVSCGSDPYMARIYQLESGCNTAAHNPGGCRGLGQACPGSKLPCSDYDWGCQDAWFRNYAVSAYGSIYNAYLFRISHNWW